MPQDSHIVPCFFTNVVGVGVVDDASFSADLVDRPGVDDVRHRDGGGLEVALRAHLPLQSGGGGGRHRQEVGRPDVGRVAEVRRVADHRPVDAGSSGKKRGPVFKALLRLFKYPFVTGNLSADTRTGSSLLGQFRTAWPHALAQLRSEQSWPRVMADGSWQISGKI